MNPSQAEWECFRDLAYFDMWCVRKVGETRFGQGFHVPSEAEALALVAELAAANHRADEAEKAARTVRDTFSKDISQGFWSRDKEYAISVLSLVLEDVPTQPEQTK